METKVKRQISQFVLRARRRFFFDLKQRFFPIFVGIAVVFPINPAFAQSILEDSSLVKKEEEDPYLKIRRSKALRVNELQECSWKVRYRNKVYDLSPLTRRGLERPLEGDMRTVLRRVPGAALQVEKIDQNNQDEKVHTAIATIGLGGLLLTRIFQGRTSDESSKSDKYIALNIISLLVFAKAIHAGWSLKQDTQERIALAVQEFNDVSSEKIVPHKEISREGGI